MVTLTQLEYIVAVDRLRHFGRAAKACHVTQPSLSMQIQKAEELLGVVIFDRVKKPVIPTEKGQELIAQAKVVLREHARFLQIGRQSADEVGGEFRLGVIPTLAPYVLPLFLERFSREYPKVRLCIDELKTSDIVRALRDDALDAGLLATPLGEAGLRERVLFYEPFYLYVSPHHPLARKRKVSEDDLAPGDMWLLADGHCFRDQVIKYCEMNPGESAVLCNVRFEGSNFETLRYLIRSGQGYTLLPHLFVESLPADERAAAVKPFEAPIPTREISLVHRRDQWKSDIIGALEGCVRACLPRPLQHLERRRIEVLEP